MEITVKTNTGADKGVETFDVEGVYINTQLISDYVKAHNNHVKRPTANAKTRSEVTGTQAKHYRQKGTGRARAGSVKSPLWRGGGVVFGPKPIRHYQKINKKQRKLALKQLLVDKIKNEDVIIVENITIDEPKTKLVAEFLKRLDVQGKAIIVCEEKDDNLTKGSRNIPGVHVAYGLDIAAYDLLMHKKIIFTEGALKAVRSYVGI